MFYNTSITKVILEDKNGWATDYRLAYSPRNHDNGVIWDYSEDFKTNFSLYGFSFHMGTRSYVAKAIIESDGSISGDYFNKYVVIARSASSSTYDTADYNFYSGNLSKN